LIDKNQNLAINKQNIGMIAVVNKACHYMGRIRDK